MLTIAIVYAVIGVAITAVWHFKLGRFYQQNRGLGRAATILDWATTATVWLAVTILVIACWLTQQGFAFTVSKKR